MASRVSSTRRLIAESATQPLSGAPASPELRQPPVLQVTQVTGQSLPFSDTSLRAQRPASPAAPDEPDGQRRASMLCNSTNAGVSGLRMARTLAFLSVATGMSACVTTGAKTESTGAAGGATAVGADAKLQTCSEPVGTVRLQDGNNTANNGPSAGASGGNNPLAILAMLRDLQSLGGGRAQAPDAGNGSVSLDSLRLLIQQSNCFLILDRGLLAEAGADEERLRVRTSGEARDGANMGPGQEVVADYVLRSAVIDMGTKDSGSVGLGGLGGVLGKALGSASIGRSVTQAKVQLVLSDIRTKVQVSVAQGSASSANVGLATNVLGKFGKALGGVNVKSDSKTSGSEILLQAFADAYNKMVPALQNYKSQQVRGGAGTGGTLRVQGSRDDAGVVKP
jgi:hypothetical protein